MSKTRNVGKAKEWRIGDHPDPLYALADAARILGRSRPTLMRWLGSLKEATGHAPVKDPAGRWFIPIPAVSRLQSEPQALSMLVAAAARSRGESLRALREELAHCRARCAHLQGEVQKLQQSPGDPRQDDRRHDPDRRVEHDRRIEPQA